jgi:very-short-patch-repair endonuclease
VWCRNILGNLSELFLEPLPPLAGEGGGKNPVMKPNKSNYHNYNPNLQPYANKLRHTMTKAEACLWKYALRARKMRGYQFRRQRTILKYIADFMCKELCLIIEVDGITHSYEGADVKDAKRQKNLENAGFIVIRYTDDQVLKSMNWVVEDLGKRIEEIERATPFTPASGGQ